MSPTVAERHATPELVAQLVDEVRQQLGGRDAGPLVVGVRAQADWTRGDLNDDHGTIRVAACTTPLAVREALADFGGESPADGDTLVVLTPLGDAELGADLLGRFVRPRLLYLNSWNAVCQRLQVRQLDPDYGTSALAWMAEALLTVPRPDLPPATSTLSVDAGLGLIARFALGADSLALDGLLRASAADGFTDRVARAGPELVGHLCDALSDRLGPAAALVCGTIRTGRGGDALPAGLAAATVVGAGGPLYAHAMLEALTGCREITDAALAAWARAAEAVVANPTERDGARLAELLTIGSRFVVDWQAPHPEASAVLTAGFEARLAALAGEIDGYLDRRTDADLASLRGAVARVCGHREADNPLSRHRAVRAKRAAQLAVWLRGSGSDAHGTAAAATDGVAPPFGDVLDGYLADGAWVDAARRRVDEGDDAPAELARVLARVSEDAYRRRRVGNQSFGLALAHWSEHGTEADVPDGPVMAVEAVLERLVVPLAASERALLVVLDGCGLPAFLELAGQFARLGLSEIGRGGRRAAGLAVLPTVTEVSRASLLCGALSPGNAEHEKRGFVAHPAVAGLPGPPARLFHHRPDLVSGVGQALPAPVLQALGAAGPRLVGAVVNTIDDELGRGDFTREYAIEHLGPLQCLLRAAADAGRYVIVTADHGHVLGVGLDGRGEARRGGEGGDRWRDATADPDRTPADDEVLLHGPRVLRGGERGVIAPTQDDLRYSARHGGYHGGATPEECLVPLSVFRPPGVAAPKGWGPVSIASPLWWDLGAIEPVEVEPSTPTKRPKRRPAPPPGQAGLFGDALTDAERALDEVGTGAGAGAGAGSQPRSAVDAVAGRIDAPWADQLLASPTFELQLSAIPRSKPPVERVRAALGALYARGGTAGFAVLARATDMPVDRVPGFVAILERLLNVEGYGVLTVDRTAQEARLDEALLRAQFLDGGS